MGGREGGGRKKEKVKDRRGGKREKRAEREKAHAQSSKGFAGMRATRERHLKLTCFRLWFRWSDVCAKIEHEIGGGRRADSQKGGRRGERVGRRENKLREYHFSTASVSEEKEEKRNTVEITD